MKRTHAANKASRTSELSLLLSRSEDDFYGSLQRAHNEVMQPPVVTIEEEPMLYSFQPVEQSLNWLGNAGLVARFL
ncbi:hypothetical protein [Spirosoma sp. KUDC1026]|uniref:hypothetical protein n=1 Tax=Spirosoma sp. KUDC1026 TaxID=2745947 RepID=UPI00159BCEA2|nr:hypothetical protein [Spirosoma sp. KUDC1026]QKZ13194.1 hypothetical protein HU175_11335 [Spirosoma sp. KUDC1026]